ncbi:MAG: hypothetical protein C0519_16035 [Hyphomicrobium sp.]|nr:hypothetical protein [Hyphomicrobium sp.]
MENDMSVLLSELIADAIKENDLDALRALGPCRAINQPNAEGDRPVIQCIKQDRREAFELLLEKGAYLDAEEDEPHPLVILAAAGKIQWIADKVDWWRMQANHLKIAYKRGKAPVDDGPLSFDILD